MNKMIVTVSGETINELRENIRALAKEFGVGVSDPQIALPLPEEAPAKKRGRPKKSEAVEPSEPVNVEVAPFTPEVKEEAPVVEEVKAATKEEAVETLAALSSAKGLTVARDLLLKFGVNRLGTLDASKYGEFVAAAKSLM